MRNVRVSSTMGRCNFIFCLLFSLSLFQTGYSCKEHIECNFGSQTRFDWIIGNLSLVNKTYYDKHSSDADFCQSKFCSTWYMHEAVLYNPSFTDCTQYKLLVYKNTYSRCIQYHNSRSRCCDIPGSEYCGTAYYRKAHCKDRIIIQTYQTACLVTAVVLIIILTFNMWVYASDIKLKF